MTDCKNISDAPKTWGEMTDAEKGALLLARYEGGVVEAYLDGGWRVSQAAYCWDHDRAYRIRPEPKVWGEMTEGMTLRDWFAGQSLKWAGHGEWFSNDPKCAAERAYKMADAMLAARKADQ